MAKTAKKESKAKGKGPSPYNAFMKEEIARLKKADPNLAHKDAFKNAAANWSKKKKA
eukprot:CAMPEP_0174929200 /NCGR_PEP_ID=MMETSP1355-20121228/27077_1 /TAXON_ID=464990 /ORGANISM="Hemiselmis tepida, Strain CCMP443" /LENGTH=56 /DNA_ID=CAMNT_0016175391 /DNA_START=17 /DNA_END=187 /DNA_ORIENTATION=+